jgi:phage gpG-like protein
MASIEIDDAALLMALRRLYVLTGDLQPAFFEIGEDWVESTKQRFMSSTDPDGNNWLLNTPATLAHKQGDKPLVGGGTLADAFSHHETADSLEITNAMEYAAMMQFGGTKAEFPHLWGDISSREFMGASDDDMAGALSILERHIRQAVGG